jgi:hypothetical protein
MMPTAPARFRTRSDAARQRISYELTLLLSAGANEHLAHARGRVVVVQLGVSLTTGAPAALVPASERHRRIYARLAKDERRLSRSRGSAHPSGIERPFGGHPQLPLAAETRRGRHRCRYLGRFSSTGERRRSAGARRSRQMVQPAVVASVGLPSADRRCSCCQGSARNWLDTALHQPLPGNY